MDLPKDLPSRYTVVSDTDAMNGPRRIHDRDLMKTIRPGFIQWNESDNPVMFNMGALRKPVVTPPAPITQAATPAATPATPATPPATPATPVAIATVAPTMSGYYLRGYGQDTTAITSPLMSIACCLGCLALGAFLGRMAAKKGWI